MPGSQPKHGPQGFLDGDPRQADQQHYHRPLNATRAGQVHAAVARLTAATAPSKLEGGTHHRQKAPTLQVVQEATPLQSDGVVPVHNQMVTSLSVPDAKFSLRSAIDKFVLDDAPLDALVDKLDQQQQGTGVMRSTSGLGSSGGASSAAGTHVEEESLASEPADVTLTTHSMAVKDSSSVASGSSSSRGSGNRTTVGGQSARASHQKRPSTPPGTWSQSGPTHGVDDGRGGGVRVDTVTLSSHLSSSSKSSAQADTASVASQQTGSAADRVIQRQRSAQQLNEQLLRQQATDMKAKQAHLQNSAMLENVVQKIVIRRGKSGPVTSPAGAAAAIAMEELVHLRAGSVSSKTDPTAMPRHFMSPDQLQLLPDSGPDKLRPGSMQAAGGRAARAVSGSSGRPSGSSQGAGRAATPKQQQQQQHDQQPLHLFQHQLLTLLHNPDGSPVLVLNGACSHLLLALVVVVLLMAGIMILFNMLVLLHALRILRQVPI